jgi:hypothetical protein
MADVMLQFFATQMRIEAYLQQFGLNGRLPLLRGKVRYLLVEFYLLQRGIQ